jgi:hypothetical protein
VDNQSAARSERSRQVKTIKTRSIRELQANSRPVKAGEIEKQGCTCTRENMVLSRKIRRDSIKLYLNFFIRPSRSMDPHNVRAKMCTEMCYAQSFVGRGRQRISYDVMSGCVVLLRLTVPSVAQCLLWKSCGKKSVKTQSKVEDSFAGLRPGAWLISVRAMAMIEPLLVVFTSRTFLVKSQPISQSQSWKKNCWDIKSDLVVGGNVGHLLKLYYFWDLGKP